MELKFGDKIRDARKAKKLTQKQLAERIGAKHNSVSDWENNKNKPDPDTIELLCGVLELSPNYLLNSDSKEFSYSEKIIIEKYRDLDDYGKETIDIALDRETERVALLKEKDDIISNLKENKHPIVIDMQEYKDANKRLVEYYHSVSAGGGIFVLGNEVTDHIAIPNTPENAKVDYAIKISGNSMLPDYCDGDIVLVSQKVEIHHGDVGIFIVDGKSYIKEYGKTELISRNPDFENIKISEYGNIVCMGKVLGKINENI